MFNWMSKMVISHFGILNPNFKRGMYTGIGQAWMLIEKLNQFKVLNKYYFNI